MWIITLFWSNYIVWVKLDFWDCKGAVCSTSLLLEDPYINCHGITYRCDVQMYLSVFISPVAGRMCVPGNPGLFISSASIGEPTIRKKWGWVGCATGKLEGRLWPLLGFQSWPALSRSGGKIALSSLIRISCILKNQQKKEILCH